MKEKLNNTFFKNYLILFIHFMAIEIIFKIISASTLLSFATVRIIIGLNIFAFILSFLLNLFQHLARKIISTFIVLVCCGYACAQIGFYNFLGVYMSFQTSSQLGAVVDYIKDFMASFKWFYFLTFIPFITVIVAQIFFDKSEKKLNVKKSFIITLSVLAVSSLLYYGSIVIPAFQNKYQAVTNKELFVSSSNPSLTIEQFGSIGFCFLDIKAMLFPVTIEDTYEIGQSNQEINPNSRIIDDTAWLSVIEEENDKNNNSLNKYFISRDIPDRNEFTGLFEGKNLIVIMMESVNDIFLNPEYYPNFNKLVEEGWYWENNYSPRNACATMNNEFSGMTSLYSIYNTCTASKYKSNTYYESMFNLFNNKEYVTFSAHDYTQAYYPRKTIHKNMGSGEYYGVEKLGIKYSNEYINWANDDDFMAAVLKIIDKKTAKKEHFMTWLTTVSSHQPYSSSSIQGNKFYDMTKKNNYPIDVRRYMSKLKILDDGLGVLLEGLKKRNILDDTVIVLYGDHYPYGISTDHLNKVLDYDTSKDMNAERVPFVIYNSEQESKVFSQYTSYINILPTLANLFNMDYDPRFYLGSDLLSEDYQSLTVFADGSWKNEIAYYNASKNKIKYYSSNEYSPEEIKRINDDIQDKISISSKVIKGNYFEYLEQALRKKQEEIDVINNTMCLNDKKETYSLDDFKKRK